jgi:spermidine/putrescine transport system permease protein
MELAAIITVILIIVSLPLAYILAIRIKSDAIKNLILFTILAPFWIDWNIRTIGWYPVFGAGGFISNIHLSIMRLLGQYNVKPISLLYTKFSIIIAWIQSYLLFMVVPIYLILLRLDPTVLKAASTLRASDIKTFYHITVKWSLPGIIIGSVFVFSLAMVDYATPLLIGGGLPTIGVTIWELGSWIEWPKAMAMSMIILVIILSVVALALRRVSITRIIY